MVERLIQVIVDEEADTARIVAKEVSIKMLALVAAAAMQEIIVHTSDSRVKEKAVEVLNAMGIAKVEKVSSN